MPDCGARKKIYIHLNAVSLGILCVFALNAWNVFLFPEIIARNSHVFLGIPLLVSSVVFFKDRHLLFRWPLMLMNMALFVNAVGCSINRGQGIWATYGSPEMRIFLLINIYFFLMNCKIAVSSMEKMFFYLSIAFCMLYILQFMCYPFPLIRNIAISDDPTEYARIRMAGQALSVIAYFMGVNKFLLTKKRKFVLQFLLGFAVIVLLGFRVQLLVLFIATLLIVYKIMRFRLRTFIFILLMGLLVIGLVYGVDSLNQSVMGMIERQQSDSFADQDYIRLINYEYHTKYFFNNDWERFWGAGLPAIGSGYGKYIMALKERYIIYADWGLVGLSWVAGIPVSILMVVYAIKAFFTKCKVDFCYARYFFLFILLSSILSREMYREGNMLLQGIMLTFINKSYFLEDKRA